MSDTNGASPQPRRGKVWDLVLLFLCAGLVIVGVIVAGLALAFLPFLATMLGCGREGYSKHFYSPRRTVDLEARHQPGGYLLRFVVRNQAGQVVDQIDTRASTVMRFNVEWLDEQDFILNSSDIGSYRYRVGANGRWSAEEDLSRRYAPGDRESVRAFLTAGGKISLAFDVHPLGEKSASTGGTSFATSIPSTDLKPEHSVDLTHGPWIVSDCLRWESRDVVSIELATSKRTWRRGSDGRWSEIREPTPTDLLKTGN